MHVPPGFTRVFPYIFAERAHEYLRFLSNGLSGEILDVHKRPDGRIANAQVRFGDTTIMVSEATERWPATRASYYIYVDDADAMMSRAIEAGGKEVSAVGDRDYGDRQGGVMDPSGNVWWLSQRLSADPY